MKANEFRIGNLIETPMGNKEIGGVCETEAPYIRLKDERYIGYRLRDCNPIRLTENILLKCGFVAKTKTDDFYKDGIAIASSYMTCRTEERSGFYLNLGNGNCPLNISINHVHELQNLYFALTGEELKVEL